MTQSLRGANSPVAHIDVAAFKPTDANAIQIGGSHYSGGKYQHWDLATDLNLRHLEGASTKYLSRFGNKTGEPAFKDLQKVQHYVAKLIEVYKAGRICPMAEVHSDYNVNRTMRDLLIDRFMSSLVGPPSSPRSQAAITLLCSWADGEELDLVMQLVEELLEEHADTADASAAAHTKERTE